MELKLSLSKRLMCNEGADNEDSSARILASGKGEGGGDCWGSSVGKSLCCKAGTSVVAHIEVTKTGPPEMLFSLAGSDRLGLLAMETILRCMSRTIAELSRAVIMSSFE